MNPEVDQTDLCAAAIIPWIHKLYDTYKSNPDAKIDCFGQPTPVFDLVVGSLCAAINTLPKQDVQNIREERPGLGEFIILAYAEL